MSSAGKPRAMWDVPLLQPVRAVVPGLLLAIPLAGFIWGWPWAGAGSFALGLALIVVFVGIVLVGVGRDTMPPSATHSALSAPPPAEAAVQNVNQQFELQLQRFRRLLEQNPGAVAGGLESSMDGEAKFVRWSRPAESAMLLFGLLDDDSARRLVRFLRPGAIKKLLDAESRVPVMDKSAALGLLEEFLDAVESDPRGGGRSGLSLQKLVVDEYGEEAATLLKVNLELGRQSSQLEKLKWLEPDILVQLLGNEHPQVQAALLACLPAEQAGKLLLAFDEETQQELMIRLSAIDGLTPHAIGELDYLLEHKLANLDVNIRTGVAGEKRVAGLLKSLGAKSEHALLSSLRELRPASAARIEDLLLDFDQLIDARPAELAKVLDCVSDVSIHAVMQTADRSVVDAFRKALSAARLQQMDQRGRTAITADELDAAKNEMLVIAKRMVAVGELAIGAGPINVF